MKKRKQSPAEVVINELGIRPLARALGLAPSTPIQWRKRHGGIPHQHHRKILELGEGRITTDDLVLGR